MIVGLNRADNRVVGKSNGRGNCSENWAAVPVK